MQIYRNHEIVMHERISGVSVVKSSLLAFLLMTKTMPLIRGVLQSDLRDLWSFSDVVIVATLE